MYACMHVCMYVCMYVCMHACVRVCVCMYVLRPTRNGCHCADANITLIFLYKNCCGFIQISVKFASKDSVSNMPILVLLMDRRRHTIIWTTDGLGHWCMYASIGLGFNSSSPNAADIRQWIGWALMQIMACRLFGVKLLSEPMQSYCQLDP